jgi:hypothetical protein
MQPTQKVTDFPHAAFELSAYDRTSSPPRDQVKKGMAESEGLGGVSPKIFEEIKDAAVPETVVGVSLKEYIMSAVEKASGGFEKLAIEHKELFDKTIKESDELSTEEHDAVMAKFEEMAKANEARFKALDAKLDLNMELIKVAIKVVRVESQKKAPLALDREAIEIASYKKGFDKAQHDAIKARKSLVTQLSNLRKAYHEKHGAPPDEDIEDFEEDYEEGAAESKEEQRQRKEKERVAKAEAKQQREDPDYNPRPVLSNISIPPKKRMRNMASGPIKALTTSSSSSSSSSSSAAAAPAPRAMPKLSGHDLKVYCDGCQAPTEKDCVCWEAEEQH